MNTHTPDQKTPGFSWALIVLYMQRIIGKDTHLWAGVLLGLLGLLINLFDIELITGVSLFFGSVASYFAFFRYGIRAGLVATVIAATFAVASFGNTLRFGIIILEFLVVWRLTSRYRQEPVVSVVLYWLAGGGWLSYILHRFVLQVVALDSSLLVLKQMVNSLLNVLLAQLLFFAVCYIDKRRIYRISIRQLLFYIVGTAIFMPVMFYAVFEIRRDYDGALRSSANHIVHEEFIVNRTIQHWFLDGKQSVVRVSQLALLPGQADSPGLQKLIARYAVEDGNISRLILLNQNHIVTAVSMKTGIEKGLRPGIDLSDRPFIKQLATERSPFITGLISGRHGAGYYRVAVVVPLYAKGQYQGALLGTLDLNDLQHQLANLSHNREIGLHVVDGSNRLVASTGGEEIASPYTRYQQSDALPTQSRVRLWRPTTRHSVQAMHNAFYLLESPLQGMSGWRVYLEAPLQSVVLEGSLAVFRVLGLLVSLILIMLLLARVISARLSRSFLALEQLSALMLDPHAKSSDLEPLSSMITEADSLGQRLQAMSDSLYLQQAMLQQSNQELEDQIAKRTKALQELSRKQEIILENANIGIALIAFRRVIWMNQRLQEILGYSYEEVCDDVRQVYPSDDLYQRIGTVVYPLLDRGETYQENVQLRHRGGHLIWVRVTGKAVEPGNPAAGNICTFDDISRQYQLVQQLMFSEAQYRTIVEVAQEGVLKTDATGAILLANQEMAEILQYQPDELLTMNLLELIPEEYYGMIQTQIARRQQGYSDRYDIQMQRKDGYTVWVMISASPYYDEYGQFSGTIGMITDISHHKAMEEELLQLRDNLQQLVDERTEELQLVYSELYLRSQELDSFFETSVDLLCIANSEGYFTRLSQSWETVLGYSQQEMMAIPYHTFIHPEDRQITNQALDIMEENRKLPNFVNRYRTKSGDYVWLEWQSTIVEQRYYAVARDVTRRHQRDQEHHQITEELRLTKQHLEELADHLTQARESERKSIAPEIHDDLGMLLTALKFDISWIKRNLPDDERLQARVSDMNTLVQQAIETLRRIVSELRPWLLDELELEATIEWHLNELKKRTGMQCIYLKEHTGDTGAVSDILKKYAVDIYRIFQEAVTNVVRHAEATRLLVTITSDSSRVCLRINDNGKGVNEKQKISLQSFGISGMHERARLAGGRLSISGWEGSGTLVELVIPLHPDENRVL